MALDSARHDRSKTLSLTHADCALLSKSWFVALLDFHLLALLLLALLAVLALLALLSLNA